MPSVSIVVPNYNHEKFLGQRINSILNQTYQDFELIILDDCSNDNSREVIENYRNNNKVSHIIYNDINTGSTFRQWKKGISVARGEFVWIAESDDWADIHFLEKTVEVLNKNIEVGLVFTQSDEVNQVGEFITTVRSLSEDKSYISLDGKQAIQSDFLFGTIIWNVSACLFRSSVINLVDNYYTDMKYRGDWLFYVSVLRYSNLYFIPERLNFMRCHSELKVTTKAEKTGVSVLEVYKLHKWLIDAVKLDKKTINKIKKSNSQRWMGSLLSRNYNFKIGMHLSILYYAFIFDKLIFFNLIKAAVYILNKKFK